MPEVTRTPVRASAALICRVRRRIDRRRPARIDEFVGELQVADPQVARDRIDQVVRVGEAVDQRIGVERESERHRVCILCFGIAVQAASAKCWAVEPVGEGRPLRFAQMQVLLGATPEHVLGGLRPFLRDEIADLGLVERAAEVPAEAGDAGGAADHAAWRAAP